MDLNKILREANMLQQKMQEQQSALEQKEFDITAAGGAITVSITGGLAIKSLKIDKDMLNPDDEEILEDAIVIAINEAIQKVQKETEKITSAATAGMSIPGF